MNPFKDIFGRAAADEREVTIVHEAGHALIAWFSPFVEEITFVSVSMRRDSVTSHVRVGFQPFPPVWYWDEACINLGGLAGQFASHGVANSRNSRNDLIRAKESLTEAVAKYGLGSCPWSDAEPCFKVDVGEMFGSPVETEVRVGLNLALIHASAMIERYRPMYRGMCEILREQGHLLPKDLTDLFGDRPWKPKP